MSLTAWTVIFSGIVAVLTAVYAILTWRLVSETRRMREAQTTPNVLVTVEPEEHKTLYLVVRNVGLAPAYNITFKINPFFEPVKGYPLSEVGFIKNRISILSPGQSIKTLLLISLSKDFEEKIDTILYIEIQYENINRKKSKRKYQIDLSQFKGMLYITGYTKYENELLNQIKDINGSLRKALNNGISVIAYKTIEELEADEEEKQRKLQEEYEKQLEQIKRIKAKKQNNNKNNK